TVNASRGSRRRVVPAPPGRPSCYHRRPDLFHWSSRPLSRKALFAMLDCVRASHILLMYRGSTRSTATRTKEEARALIEDIERAIQAGEDFAELARKYSDCPSRTRAGDLGSFGRGQMVKPF